MENERILSTHRNVGLGENDLQGNKNTVIEPSLFISSVWDAHGSEKTLNTCSKCGFTRSRISDLRVLELDDAGKCMKARYYPRLVTLYVSGGKP